MWFKSLRSKILFTLFISIIGVSFNIGYSYFKILSLQDQVNNINILADEMLQVDTIKFSVVEIQQFLTDASLTFEKESLDEAKKFKELAIKTANGLSLADPSLSDRIKVLKEDIEQLYSTGETMYLAYSKEGKDAGQKIMKADNGFDKKS